MEMRPPRMLRNSVPRTSSLARSISVPFLGSRKMIEPLVMFADRGSSPMIACADTDLPEPDSPTSAIEDFGRTRNERLRRAWIGPAGVANSIDRFWTSRRFCMPLSGHARGGRPSERGLWREPAHTRPAAQPVEERIEELPARRIMHEMMGQEAGRLVRIRRAGAARFQMRDDIVQNATHASKPSSALPGDDISMAVRLCEARQRLRHRTRPEGRDAFVTERGDAGKKARVDSVRRVIELSFLYGSGMEAGQRLGRLAYEVVGDDHPGEHHI